MKPVIAITVGDYNGIGPEVALKAFARSGMHRICTPVFVGPAKVFEQCAKRSGIPFRFRPFPLPPGTSMRTAAVLEPAPGAPVRVIPGRLSADAGAAAGAAIERAVELLLSGEAAAVVTSPVSKQAMHLAGINVPGQTEYLQRLTGSPRVAMMLVGGALRIGLATIHIPIKSVPRTLTAALLRERITVIHDALRCDWRIRSPRLAVLGLNPHAGENGEIGNEEQRVILPVVASLRRGGMRLEGPFPADAFFARHAAGTYDGVVAMYHDQGLIPIKMATGGRAVNVSAGLPVVRTSPGHGTAFDIAGRGIADPAGMIDAIHLAVTLAETRRRKHPEED